MITKDAKSTKVAETPVITVLFFSVSWTSFSDSILMPKLLVSNPVSRSSNLQLVSSGLFICVFYNLSSPSLPVRFFGPAQPCSLLPLDQICSLNEHPSHLQKWSLVFLIRIKRLNPLDLLIMTFNFFLVYFIGIGNFTNGFSHGFLFIIVYTRSNFNL
ncbi:hypothetical protein P3S68_023894 [Capsicum galapagoense]